MMTSIPRRAVAEEQRSLALGFQSVLWRAFGAIPGPIIFGVIFDASCVYWQFDCGRRGNCWVHNNGQISTRIFFTAVTGVLINFVFMLLCWIFYPPITCRTDKTAADAAEEEEEKKEEEELKGMTNPTFCPESKAEKGLANGALANGKSSAEIF